VFDWDGTLMDSTAQIIEAAARAIGQLGLPQRPADAIREIIGLGLRDSWQRLFPDVAAEHFMPFIEAYRNHYLSAELAGPLPFGSTERTLARLSDDGFQLAVATGKSRAGLERDLERTGLGRYFHATRTADDCRAKPCPDMLTEILGALRSEASATVMVGDTEWDLEMARRAGVTGVAVAWGAHTRERLLPLSPAICLDGLDGLPDWLQDGQSEPAQRAGEPDERQADEAGGVLAVDALEKRNAQ
jgi:phosphoglycolate phosphatase